MLLYHKKQLIDKLPILRYANIVVKRAQPNWLLAVERTVSLMHKEFCVGSNARWLYLHACVLFVNTSVSVTPFVILGLEFGSQNSNSEARLLSAREFILGSWGSKLSRTPVCSFNAVSRVAKRKWQPYCIYHLMY